MKKINLLKPEVVTGYLDNGKGQEITYLQVRPEMNAKHLHEDIESGASYLHEVMEIAKKKPSRFVVVKCQNQEEGLMAVSYLSAIYNVADGREWDDCEDEGAEDVSSEQTLTFKDYSEPEDDEDEEEEEGVSDLDMELDFSGPPLDWQATSSWDENPWMIPIVTMEELIQGENGQGVTPFFDGNKGFGMFGLGGNRVPYWKSVRKENICILLDPHPSVFADVNFAGFDDKVFKRYEGNRHVFLVVTDRFANERDPEMSPEELMFCPSAWYETPLAMLVLNYSAEVITMFHPDDALAGFYAELFENWVAHFGYSLCKDFPVEQISKKIAQMREPSKSGLFEKVIRYAVKDLSGKRALHEDDFRVLNKIGGLGFSLENGEGEHNNFAKLEKSLVGMEDIKEQIRNIVEVFRYNKLRLKMGLKGGTYHNVHMMLGAPGTAKTTVAQILGSIMAEEKLLHGSNFISINGAELKGKYVGHSAPKVKKLFDENYVIFVDEAYSVTSGEDGQDDSFSQEAIAQLIIELEKHGMDRLIIFAGYGGPNVRPEDNKMVNFLNSNPGIRSRINSTIFFDSYGPEQMVKIFRGLAINNSFKVSRSADRYVKEYFAERVGMPDFGNGREARSLLENASAEAAKRICKLRKTDITVDVLKEITTQDVRAAIEKMRKAAYIQRGAGENRFGF